MDKLRKISLILCCGAFCVCCMFLNLIAGIAMCCNNYSNAGSCLIISTGLLLIALVAAFFKKTAANVISAVMNIAGTVLYVIPISILNAVPSHIVARADIEKFTSRIYPAVSVTILLATAVFADVMSYDRAAERARKREEKLKECKRSLRDDEKIV